MLYLLGQANRSKFHPDYIPSKFPEEYKTKTSRSSNERLQRTIERDLRVLRTHQETRNEEARVLALEQELKRKQDKELKEAERLKEIEARKREREEKENTRRAESEKKKKDQEKAREERLVKEQAERLARKAKKDEWRQSIELKREALRLEKEREEEEKLAQQHRQFMMEYEQSMERVVAFYNERHALEQQQEEEMRKLAEREEKKRKAKAEIARLQAEFSTCVDGCTQTLPDQLLVSEAENKKLKSELKASKFGIGMLEGDDTKTKFYTGLPTWSMFVYVFTFVSRDTPSRGNQALSLEDQFLLVLVKLRLNLLLEDLAQRFQVSATTVSSVLVKWIDILYVRLHFLIAWPQREIVRENMPPVFRQTYPHCVCIIDCSEVFIETPTSFTARSATYSNYKKHNTVKFLIGITPSGSISFLSKCWGGRVSDKVLTQQSGFLDMLEHGDTVLADRGFTIADDIALHGAKLVIPSFTRGKVQLSQKEVEMSKQMSQVRIHVERIIGLLKNKYTILKGPLRLSLVKHKGDVDLANIDKILIVCSALTNLSTSVVS